MHFVNINCENEEIFWIIPTLKILSLQDSHPLWFRPPREPAEVRQQPEEPLQRGLQQVRLQLSSEERRQPDQRLAVVTLVCSHHHQQQRIYIQDSK